MTDLIERLRAPDYWMSGSSEGHEGENDAPREAADEIERLRAALVPLVALAGAIRDDAAKATPGPWWTNDDGEILAVDEAYKTYPWFVAKVYPCCGYPDCSESNLALIRAVPDMSAAILAAADAAGGEA